MEPNVTALSFTGGRVPRLRKALRATPEPPQLVDVREVPRAAVAVALELAQGDASRLSFLPDGTVMVTNAPRRASRTQEPRR